MKLKNLLKIFTKRKHFFFRVDMVNSTFRQKRLLNGEKTYMTGYVNGKIDMDKIGIHRLNTELISMGVESFSKLGVNNLSESSFIVTQLSRLD